MPEMIERVRIQNFRSLRDVDFTLAPLTALVGPNASGKSSVLAALHQPNWSSPEHSWRQAGGAIQVVRVDGAGRPVKPQAAMLLRLDPGRLRTPNQLGPATALDPTGGNLSNLFVSLTREDQITAGKRLAELVPVFSDVQMKPHGSGTHRVHFRDRWDPSVWYSPDQVSDGTMYMLAFLLLQYQATPPDLLCIEEPERGLHPYLLGKVVDMLRQLAEGKLGPRAIQVVLATQSAELMEFLRPEEVRFLTRNPDDGSVKIEAAPVDEPAWQEAYREYAESLGSMWLSGGLGGVPGV